MALLVEANQSSRRSQFARYGSGAGSIPPDGSRFGIRTADLTFRRHCDLLQFTVPDSGSALDPLMSDCRRRRIATALLYELEVGSRLLQVPAVVLRALSSHRGLSPASVPQLDCPQDHNIQPGKKGEPER